jgi:hypothetical protein
MAAQTSTRTPFTLFNSACIVGDEIAKVHHNACPAFQTERTEDCRCDAIEYRLVPVTKRERG